MKSFKATIAAIATLASTITFGGGLYFVSGGDFRLPVAEYIIYTTENNQTVNVSPKSGPATWSVKVENTEIQGTNGQYVEYTFPAAGYHKVKLYCTGDASGATGFGFGYNSYITPASVTRIKEMTFYGNVNVQPSYLNLTNVIFKNTRKIYKYQCGFNQWGSTASNKYSVKFIGTTTPIEFESEAFAFSGIQSITIPDTVERIGYSAFTHSWLTKITLPNRNITVDTSSFKTSGDTNFTSVFRNCTLTDVFFKGSLEDWNNNETYKYLFGEPTGNPDATGAYVLSYSQYAQFIEDQITNWESYGFKAKPRADSFYPQSRDGKIKLHLNAE